MIQRPVPFLTVRSQAIAEPLGSTVLCAGYELTEWRARQFAESLIQWLPYAALSQEDQLRFGIHNYYHYIKRAAYHIYTKKDDLTRGEVGELLLHQASVQFHSAIPVVCKLLLKTSPNDNVKGYDGIFLCPKPHGDFDIWLGEAKLYGDPKDAAAKAMKSIEEHFIAPFVNAEKAMVIGHIEKTLPYYDEVQHLFTNETSADELFSKSVFPVLLTYDSSIANNHTSVSDIFISELKIEAEIISKKFHAFAKLKNIRIHLILIPLKSKKSLLHEFDKRIAIFNETG